MWILPKNYPLSSHYVADMVESSEDLSLLDTIIGSSLFVRSKPMSKSSLLRKWKRDKWFQRLCGQILKPSQHRSFETRLISYLQAILANRLAKPVDVGGKMIHATCGPTSRNTSEQLDLFNVSSKTCKDTSRWDSPQSSQIWKNWVIEQRGEYSQRKKSAHLIREKECLSWPTPIASSGGAGNDQNNVRGVHQGNPLATAVTGFQPAQNKTSMNGKNQELSNWPTPRHQDGKHGAPTDWEMTTDHVGTANSLRVKAAKENWATPKARDHHNAVNPEFLIRKDGRHRMDALPEQTKYDPTSYTNWPTPRHSEYKGCGPIGSKSYQHFMKKKYLTAQVMNFQLDQNKTSMNDGKNHSLRVKAAKEKHGGKLNPDWCEQLMGLPVGWTKINDTDDRISRLMAIGNGVVPQTAALAWEILNKKLMTTKTED